MHMYACMYIHVIRSYQRIDLESTETGQILTITGQAIGIHWKGAKNAIKHKYAQIGKQEPEPAPRAAS